MTPQEQEMIDGLISRIRGTQVQNKDTAAEARLQAGLAGYPDSLYVLAQTVLVQQYGLQQAQAQLEDLKQQNAALQDQLQNAAGQAKGSGGSFLSHIFGGGGGSVAGQPAPPAQNPSYQPVNSGGYGGQPPYPGSSYPPAPAYPPAGGMFGGGGGFLQGALQTAAGVAAGEMVFQGMEGLFHGFEHGGGDRGFAGAGGGETVVNNYYDDDRGGNDRGGSNREDSNYGGNDRDSGNFYNPSDDASRSDSTQFADTGDNDTGDNDGGFNDSGDDGSSFDDGGSDDMSNS